MISGSGPIRRVAMLSVHTCPLDQPGTGDSGGMNVVIRSVARQLAGAGVAVDIFTRRAGEEQAVVEMDPGVRVVHLRAGPPRPVAKEELPDHLPAFLCSLLRFETDEAARTGGTSPLYDIVHSHYWLSGWIGRLARERWSIPFVQTFHTLGRVKNRDLGDPEGEPAVRLVIEERVAQAADCVLAPTLGEAADLVRLYGARPYRVRVLSPGVDTERFTPGDAPAARAALGLGERPVVLFAGRLQPLKAPHVALRAIAHLAASRPGLDPVLLVLGGPSGSGGISHADLAAEAHALGIGARLKFHEPVPHDRLPEYYRAADLVLVPSRSESFGLVALEAAACGTPVVASDVGGLRTAVVDGETGILVRGADPAAFARAAARILSDAAVRGRMSRASAEFARDFDWRRAAGYLLSLYEELAGGVREAAGAGLSV